MPPILTNGWQIKSNQEAKEIEMAKQPTKADNKPEIGRREGRTEKINTTLVPYALSCAAAVGLNHGATKYSPKNYRKGLSTADCMMSIERHCKAIQEDEFLDADSYVPHMCLLAASVAMYVDLHTSNSLTDKGLNVPAPETISEISRYFKQFEVPTEEEE